MTTRNFSTLIQKARLNLKRREDTLLYPSQALPTADFLSGQMGKPRAATFSDMPLGNWLRQDKVVMLIMIIIIITTTIIMIIIMIKIIVALKGAFESFCNLSAP